VSAGGTGAGHRPGAPHRAVEVLHDRGVGHAPRWRVGSGYLIGARSVLTAAHCVLVDGAVLGEIFVRVQGGPGNGAPREYRARIAAAAEDGADLALLTIDDPWFGPIDVEPVSWARVERASAEPVIGCWAVGFPAFKVRRHSSGRIALRDTAQVTGRINPGSNLVSGMLELQVSAAPRPLPQGTLAGSEWEGMSGALIFAPSGRGGPHAVGVVVEHQVAEGVSALTAVPVTRIAALLAAAGGTRRPADRAPEGWVVLPRATAPRAPAYRDAVARFAARTPVLLGREDELNELVAFARGELDRPENGHQGFRWIVGGPWAGKTALAAHVAATCGPNVDVVAYFLTRRQSDADSNRFTSVMSAQLAWLLQEDPPPAEEGGDGLLQLWDRAVDQAERDERPLLLVVDGLDEDVGPTSAAALASVASRIPGRTSHYAHVLVTSRRHPRIPADVEPEHPLRLVRPVELDPSPDARTLQQAASGELEQLLSNPDVDDVAYDCLGLLAAARGALTAADLTELVADQQNAAARHVRRRVDRALTRAIGRVVEASGAEFSYRYTFAHQALLDRCVEVFTGTGQLEDYQQLLDRWVDRYSERGWPAGTPHYLLGTHAALLAERGAPRLRALLGDVAYLDAAVAAGRLVDVMAATQAARVVFPDDATIAEVVRCLLQQAHNLDVPEPRMERGYPARQLALQARRLASPLGAALAEHLARTPAPRFVPAWTSAGASMVLVRRTVISPPARLVGFDGSGTSMITSGPDGMRWWTLGDPAPAACALRGHVGPVRALVVSSGGTHALSVAIGDAGDELRWWELGGETPVSHVVSASGSVVAMALTEDGRRAMVSTESRYGGELRWWELSDAGVISRAMSGPRGIVRRIGIAPDARHALTAGRTRSGTAELFCWSLDDLDGRELHGHGDAVRAIAMSPSGDIALTVAGAGAGRVEHVLWHLAGGASVARPGGSPDVELATFAPGKRRVLAAGAELWWWNPWEPGERVRLAGHTAPVRVMAIAPDGRQALTAASHGARLAATGSTGELLRWNLAVEPPSAQFLAGHTGQVLAVAIDRDGRTARSASHAEVLTWDLGVEPSPESGSGAARHGELAGAVASPDGVVVTWAARGSGADAVLRWDVALEHPEAGPIDTCGPVRTAAISGNGQRLMTVGSGGVESGMLSCWDLRGTPLRRRLAGRGPCLGAVAISPNGDRALSGHESRYSGMELVLWDLAADRPSARRLGGLPGAIAAMAFSPDGRRALTLVQPARFPSRRELLLWALDDDRAAPRHLVAGGDTIRTFAVSHDGTSLIAAASGSGPGDRCWLVGWDLDNPAPQPTPIGRPTVSVDVMTFRPDGAGLLLSHGSNLLSWDFREPQPRLVADVDDPCLAIGVLRRPADSGAVVTVGRSGLVLWTL
jgi:WD40 repeat protein